MTEHAHGGHRKRMRARYLQGGLEGFAPHEALELLLFYAIPQRNVNPLAHQLLDHFGSLEAVLSASPEQLAQAPGIGETSAVLLSLVFALTQYTEREKQMGRAVITNYREAKEYCLHLFAGKRNEVLYVICLDAQGRVLRAVPAIDGTIDEITIYPRTIVSAALLHNAHAVVLAHNHPSGVAEPSAADIQTTQMLQNALHAVDIRLMDHIIYAEGVCASMQEYQRQHATPTFAGDRAVPRAADTQKPRKRGKRADT